MKRKFEDTWESLRPEIRKGNGDKTTPRDGTNMGLSTAFTVILTWGLTEAGITVPPTVAVAIATIIGYFVARKLRY